MGTDEVSCDVSSESEDEESNDCNSLFGNFINNTDVTINLFKLTPQDVLTDREQKASDDQTFFRELSMLRERRASKMEHMSH